MTLWLLRHARPLAPTGLCYGQLDLAADAAHTAQVARAFLEELQRLGVSLAQVRCSPLQRTRALAQALGQTLALPAQEDARLAEMHFGRWEGVPWSEIPQAAVQAWTDDFADHAFGGQESCRQVLERVWAALQQARRSPGPQLWVTHAGVVRAVQVLLERGGPFIERAQDWPQQAPACGGWTVVSLESLPLA